ncbi:hypothetical protein [Streptomyces sp. NPDC008092]|uniref:hypothetical protein n=1 Tax=Streptomyces sp. NPDC008092 TaxID=3364808 RepID=UPI0036E23588
MDPAVAGQVLPADLRDRLAGHVRLAPGPVGAAFPAAFAEAEVLISGWGCPRLTAGAQGSEVRRLGRYAVAEVERWAAGEPLLGQVTREALHRLA